jgi:hypothetical protein
VTRTCGSTCPLYCFSASSTLSGVAGRGDAINLPQYDLSVASADGHDGIFQVDEVLALQLQELHSHFIRVVFVVKGNRDQVARSGLLE